MEAPDRCGDRFARHWQALTPRKRAAEASAMLVFAVIALFCLLFAVLPLTGNGLILQDDNFRQHYPFLIAIGRWVRDFFRDPLHAPMFDFSLGLGADWIGSLNYYGVGDPLTLLSALFPPSLTHVCYTLLAVIRHELAALSFLALARCFGVRWRYALVAAAAYSFSNYMIAWCTLIHPMFANPVIQLPLMILGCEKRFRGEKPWVLMLSTAWSALCAFYFFYMNSFMLFLFALIRYFSAYRRDLSFPRAFLRAFGPFMLGTGLALPVLAPALAGYLDSARTAMPAGNSLLFAKPANYWQFPIAFVASNGWNNAMTVPLAALMGVCAMTLTLQVCPPHKKTHSVFVLANEGTFSVYVSETKKRADITAGKYDVQAVINHLKEKPEMKAEQHDGRSALMQATVEAYMDLGCRRSLNLSEERSCDRPRLRFSS